MTKSVQIKFDRKEVLYHVIFWTVHLILRLYFRGYFNDRSSELLYEEFLTLPVRMFGAYLTIFLFRHYMFKRKYTSFFVLLPLSVILILFIRRLVGYFFVEPLLYTDFIQSDLYDIDSIFKYTVYVYPVISTAVIITVLRKWYSDQVIKSELEKETLKAQLNQLKGQIQPHFLFNTLNNIYSLSIENSTHTSESILKLSDLLDYMLYKTNKPVVNLSDEIKHIMDYIELEKLRYGNRLDIRFNIQPNMDDVKIAPLLFLPIVENCFKHGAGKTIGKVRVSIEFVKDGDNLVCKFENSKNEVPGENIEEGIGLNNVQRRMGMLYGDNYELNITNNKDSFLVMLRLNVSFKPANISL